MDMCRYGISLWVCNLISHSLCSIVRYKIERKKRHSISTSSHVLLCLLYNNAFEDFPKIFNHFLKISGDLQKFCKGHKNVSQQFPKSSKYYQRWLKIEEDPKMFQSYTKKCKLLTISKDFRPLSEDMENMPHESQICFYEFHEWCIFQ